MHLLAYGWNLANPTKLFFMPAAGAKRAPAKQKRTPHRRPEAERYRRVFMGPPPGKRGCGNRTNCVLHGVSQRSSSFAIRAERIFYPSPYEPDAEKSIPSRGILFFSLAYQIFSTSRSFSAVQSAQEQRAGSAMALPALLPDIPSRFHQSRLWRHSLE